MENFWEDDEEAAGLISPKKSAEAQAQVDLYSVDSRFESLPETVCLD
jgi:hypothetical protein